MPLQGQLCRAGRTRGQAGQQNIKGSKLFSDYFVYCASGFWLGEAVILPSLPWAVKAIKAFVLDWCLGKSDPVLGLFLYPVCQVACYLWHTCDTFLSLLLPQLLHITYAERELSMAVQKQTKSRQPNPSYTQDLASCFCKGLPSEQEPAHIFREKHNVMQIPCGNNLSQLKICMASWRKQ